MCKQILQKSNITNMWKTVRRSCMLILGFGGLNNIMTKIIRDNKNKMLKQFPLNVRAVSAKIKLPKKYLQHCHILRTDKKNLSLLLLPSRPRERKLDLKLSIFQLKRCSVSVQNKMAPVFSILLQDLKLIFLRMLENFIAGSLGQVN